MPTHSTHTTADADQRGLLADILTALSDGTPTASSSFAPAADPDARRIIINGSVILNGVPNVEQLYDELQAEARRRNAGGA
jgi:hypothetical protein